MNAPSLHVTVGAWPAFAVAVIAASCALAPIFGCDDARPQAGGSSQESASDLRYYLTMHGAMGSDSVVGLRADGTLAGTVSVGVPGGEELHLLRGLCPLGDGTYLLVNAFKESTRVLRFGPPSPDGTTPFNSVVIRGGDANPEMVHTYALAIGPDGAIYCSNQDTDTVTRYAGVASAQPGAPLPVPKEVEKHGLTSVPGLVVPSEKQHPDGIRDVRGIAFGPDGLLYVADRERSHVVGYDVVSGKRERTLASGDDGLQQPIQIVFTPDGSSAFISDDKANCVWRVDVGSRKVTTFIATGSAGLDLPSALLIDGDRLIVGSRGGREVLAYRLADGSPIGGALASHLSDGPEFIMRAPTTPVR